MHKLFKTITLPITEDEYRSDGNLHYSTLATYERGGFGAIATLKDKKESPSLLFGSLVDLMITGSREEFESQYIVAEFATLKPMHLSVVKALFEKYHSIYPKLSKIPDADLLEVANEVDFGKSWREATRINSIRTECDEYYNLMVIAEGKTVIDAATYEEAAAATRALKTSPATAWYFVADNPFDNIERVYQAKFKADFDGITYSAMAD